jgi:hypothetical protein
VIRDVSCLYEALARRGDRRLQEWGCVALSRARHEARLYGTATPRVRESHLRDLDDRDPVTRLGQGLEESAIDQLAGGVYQPVAHRCSDRPARSSVLMQLEELADTCNNVGNREGDESDLRQGGIVGRHSVLDRQPLPPSVFVGGRGQRGEATLRVWVYRCPVLQRKPATIGRRQSSMYVASVRQTHHHDQRHGTRGS